jgi:hypothetical protein
MARRVGAPHLIEQRDGCKPAKDRRFVAETPCALNPPIATRFRTETHTSRTNKWNLEV